MANSKEKKGAANVNSALNNSEAFFVKYQKAITIAVIAIIVIIAGTFLYKQYVAGPREDKASTELAKGQEYFQNQIFDKALNGDGANFAGFKKIASDYSGTDAANLANLYTGLCYAQTGKWNDAVKYLEEFEPSDDEMLSPMAEAALGNAYANTKQYDKAVEALKKAADMADDEADGNANSSVSPRALLQAGMILESQGKKDDALKLYQEIKKKYLNSPVYQDIDKYIERATK